MSCNIPERYVISAPDIESIYEVPINFELDDLSRLILKKLNLPYKPTLPQQHNPNNIAVSSPPSPTQP